MLMHNTNVIARIVFYSLWAWIFYFDGLELSYPMRSFLNWLVLADIATWLMYQIYLLPRMILHSGFGSVINLAVMILLFRDAQSLVPQTIDMQAMALMVFLSMFAVKGFYYTLIEMSNSR